MLRLRTILLYNYPYIIVLLLTIVISLFRINYPNQDKYKESNYNLKGIVKNYYKDGDKLTIEFKQKEVFILNYYYKSLSEKQNNSLNIGDYILVKVDLEKPKKNTNQNLFNYQDYLNRKNIHYIGTISSYKVIRNSNSIYYKLRNIINNYIGEDPYLNAFILGNKHYITSEVLNSYQYNGISHLFAISGMHIGLLSSIILFILKKLKVKENTRILLTIVFLIIYLFFVTFSISVLRGVIFFILFSLNKHVYFYIKSTNLYLIALSICLLINPLCIFEVSFLYSFIISLILIISQDYINKVNNYFYKLLKVSFLSFIISFPITIYNFFSINILSIIYNLFYVPLVSIIIFPLALLTFIIPVLKPLFHVFIHFLESSSLFLSKIDSTIVFPKISIYIYFLYYVLLFLIYKYRLKIIYILLIILVLFHYKYYDYTKFIQINDVSQGDSTIIHLNKKVLLIDTGGKVNNNYSSWKKRKNNINITSSITIPTLKGYGVSKIEYLILTHGDYDHMGETINLVNNFKVEKVIFNCGEFNDLEKELIKVLNKKKIPYYSCIKELNIDNTKLYFLQTKEYDNENDNSNVIYTELNGYKFMFMGDASTITEKEIIDKYNLPNIDVLKVGHHGSRTSSGKEFIDEINPKYGVISVGKNNRYGHPNKEVLNNLEQSKIYRTDQDGSIMFKIKNNKLKVETCSP